MLRLPCCESTRVHRLGQSISQQRTNQATMSIAAPKLRTARFPRSRNPVKCEIVTRSHYATLCSASAAATPAAAQPSRSQTAPGAYAARTPRPGSRTPHPPGLARRQEGHCDRHWSRHSVPADWANGKKRRYFQALAPSSQPPLPGDSGICVSLGGSVTYSDTPRAPARATEYSLREVDPGIRGKLLNRQPVGVTRADAHRWGGAIEQRDVRDRRIAGS